MLGCTGRNLTRVRELVPKHGQLFPKNHLGKLVKLAPSQFYLLVGMIWKVKGETPPGSAAGGLLFTL